MKELTFEQVSAVSGADAGAVFACVSVGTLGMKAGSYVGPMWAFGGAVGGCLTGLAIYYL